MVKRTILPTTIAVVEEGQDPDEVDAPEGAVKVMAGQEPKVGVTPKKVSKEEQIKAEQEAENQSSIGTTKKASTAKKKPEEG